MRKPAPRGNRDQGLAVLGAIVLLLSSCAAPEPMRGISSMGVIYSVPTEERIVVLTIDDGPNPDTTEDLLHLLRENDATATFFIVGDQVEGTEALLRKVVAEGPELGNHGRTREMAFSKPVAELKEDLESTGERLESISGDAPRWFRPGLAFYHQAMLDTASDLGYETVLADVLPLDFAYTGQDFQVEFVKKKVRPGSIVVFHEGEDLGPRTTAVLARLLPALREQGYEVMSLGEAMNRVNR